MDSQNWGKSSQTVTKDDQTLIIATITVIYDHGRSGIDEKLTRFHHEYNDLITGNIHIQIK
ncbi:MAG: hypothetical protein ACE5I5_15835 [Candidatus Heimdallarchaeota archaeon]